MHQKCLFSVCTAQSIAKQSFGIFVMVKQDYSIAISETIHVIVVSLLRGSWPFKLLHPSSIHIPYDGLKTPVLLRRGPVRGEVVVQPWFIMKVSKSKITWSCGHMKTSSMCFDCGMMRTKLFFAFMQHLDERFVVFPAPKIADHRPSLF